MGSAVRRGWALLVSVVVIVLTQTVLVPGASGLAPEGPQAGPFATQAATATSGAFVALAPARLADTRPGEATADGQVAGSGAVGPDGTLRVPLIGRSGIPPLGAAAVALNVTAVGATAPTFLTVYPTGAGRPGSSNLNPVPGQTATNMVIAKVGGDGSISVYNAAGSIHVIVDVLGYFPIAGGFLPLDPARLADTRPGQTTYDWRVAGVGAVTGGTALQVPVNGRAGIGAAGAVALNVTALSASEPTYLTAYPTDGLRPNASNLNLGPGQTATNMVIAKVGGDGSISVFSAAGTTQVIVDVLGWFPAGTGFTPIAPARLADTRPGAATVDLATAGVGAVGPGGVLRIVVPGRAGVPGGGVGTVAVNITVVGATTPTYLTVFPSGAPLPATSNLNLSPGQTATNMAMARIGSDGSISVFNAAGAAHVIVDILGWFPGTAGGTPPVRWTVPTGRPTRVEFIGDSVTEGVAKAPGGLASIPGLMRGYGYDVALVGTLSANGIGHDGHGGSCIDDTNGRCLHTSGYKGEGLLQAAPGWLQQAAPDVIVLNAGNNDRYVVNGWYFQPELVADAMARLIDSLTWSAPQAMILVTRFKFRTDLTGSNENQVINDLYARVVADKAAAGRNVRFVDLYRQVTQLSDYTTAPNDVVHLSDAGWPKLAAGAAGELKTVFDANRF